MVKGRMSAVGNSKPSWLQSKIVKVNFNPKGGLKSWNPSPKELTRGVELMEKFTGKACERRELPKSEHKATTKNRRRKKRKRKKGASIKRKISAGLAAIKKYQNESFNTTLHQLNQEPQVCLPRPPSAGPIAAFAPPPSRMFRGRTNWRQYHHNYFSHERAGGRPYRRRRSHLDDIYLPNYEDNDDVCETEDVSEHHRERFQNRSNNAWNKRHRSPNVPQKKEIRQRCLVSTESRLTTSKVCADDKDKAGGKKDIELTSDNVPPTECETMKDSKKVESLNFDEEKDKTVVEQIKTKPNTDNEDIKSNAGLNSIANTLVKCANVEDCNSSVTKCHDIKQNKLDHEGCTSKTSGAPLDSSLESVSSTESFLAAGDKAHTLAEETTMKYTSVDVDMCHTLPAEFPTWESLQMESKYQNLYTSVKEIDSDQETVCFDDITVDKIDTTKSYLENLGPELDDYRVVDMVISTPSPPKRPAREDDTDAMTKKKKYDCLHAEINSDELLSEIEEILRGDKQSGESTTPKCTKRYRSKSLNIETGEKSTLRRSSSLQSLDKSNNQIMYNFDLKTNLLLLLRNQKLTDVSEDDTKMDVEKANELGNKPGEDEAAVSIFHQNVSKDIKCPKEKSNDKENETKAPNSESKLVPNATAPIGNISVKSMSKDAVGQKDLKENDSTDLNVTKSYSSPTNSVKDNRTNEGSKKEKRANDETRRGSGNVKSYKTDDKQANRVDFSKWSIESSYLVKYSDYKKSVDFSKKSPPPEMKLCTIMANPKKITSRRMTFSNENELYLQKMHKLFGSDSDIEDFENGDKCSDEKSKKRKDERDHGSNKKEPQPKKLLVESIKQPTSKPKDLDKTRRYSTPGHSVSDSPKLVDVNANERQGSNNSLQKVHSAALGKSNQHNTRDSTQFATKKASWPSASTVAKSADYSKKNERRIPMPLITDKKGDINNQNVLAKPNARGGLPKSEVRTQNSEKSKDERCNDVEKTDEKQDKYPAGTICKQDRGIEGNKSPKLVDENKNSTFGKSAAQSEVHNNLLKDGKPSQPRIQKEIVHATTSRISGSLSGINNPSTLQPKLVLNRIEDPASNNTVAVEKKELPVKKAIETFAFDLNYTFCSPLTRDRFPMMQKIRMAFAENECSDRVIILETPDVRDEIQCAKQVVNISAVSSEKESDDVIEIRPDIPIIDLTDDNSDPPSADVVLVPDKKEGVDLTLDAPNSAEERITLYRSEETLNNSLEVQAMVASMSSNLNGGNHNQQPEEIKNDDTATAEVNVVPQATSAPQKLSNNTSGDVTLLLIEKAINDAISLQKQQNQVVNKPEAKTHTVQVSGTYRPLSGVPDANSYSNTNSTAPNVSISSRRSLMGPPPSSVQRNSTAQFSRRNDDNGTSAPYTVAQSPRRLETDPQQITLGFLLQSSGAESTTKQVPVNAIAQSPRRTDGAREQHFQTESNSAPVIFNTLARNNLPPSSSRIDTIPRVDVNLASHSPARTESGQNFFGIVQSPRRTETTNGQMHPYLTQSSEPSCSATPRRRDSMNVDGPSTFREQNAAGQSPRLGNNGVDSPLRGLRQLVVAPEPLLEIGNREANAVGLILVRYLYFFDGLKKAQMAYNEELKKMNRCLPNIVKLELIQFENTNSAKFYILSKDLIKDLRALNLTAAPCNYAKIQMIMNSVFKSIKIEVPNLTLTWLYLMLEALMQPEMAQYMNVQFLTDMYTYVTYVTSKIHNRTISMQNNASPQDLFTPEQRRLLERQLHQYKAICTNQVTLISMESSLQSSLLRAHQNNQNAKVNQQNVLTAKEVDAQSRFRITSGGLIQVQPSTEHWRRADSQNSQVNSSPPQIVNTIANVAPPNVSLPSNNNPTASQQTNNSLVPPRHPEVLKNILLNVSSPKRPGKRVSRANSHNLTVHSNVIVSPTSTSASTCSPRRSQPDIPSNVLKPKSRNSRRNSSPSMVIPILSKSNDSTKTGTNDNFRIRLPFTLPYDISSVAHKSPGLAGASPSMPVLEDSPVNLPNLSHIQSVARSPVYAPMAIIHPIVSSPSPPPEVSEQPTAPVVEAAETREDINAPEATFSMSDQDALECKATLIKSETELQLKDKDVEVIDLTWLDDVDPEQLQNEIECFAVKKEEPFEEKITKEADVTQEPVHVAHSPADSGISSPSIQVEYNEQVFSDRTCICGKPAEYVCGCIMAMYCSEPCQLKDWKAHKEVCLKHNVKGGKEGAQHQ